MEIMCCTWPVKLTQTGSPDWLHRKDKNNRRTRVTWSELFCLVVFFYNWDIYSSKPLCEHHFRSVTECAVVCVCVFCADINRQAPRSEMNERADWTEADEVDWCSLDGCWYTDWCSRVLRRRSHNDGWVSDLNTSFYSPWLSSSHRESGQSHNEAVNGTRTETRAGRCEIKKQNFGLLDEVFFSCEPVIKSTRRQQVKPLSSLCSRTPTLATAAAETKQNSWLNRW